MQLTAVFPTTEIGSDPGAVRAWATGVEELGFDRIMAYDHVLGADHGGYVKRMKAAVAALSDGKVPLDVVLTQIVRVVKNGEPVRMSKRAGTYVTVRDLIEEVGRDAVRFTMLTRKADAQMEFDLDAVVAQTRENPVFYVQYAHARCRFPVAKTLHGYEHQRHPLVRRQQLHRVADFGQRDPGFDAANRRT